MLPLSIWIALSGTAQAGVTDDVARAWYLWTTGQDEAAHELAMDLADAHPDRYDVHRLAIAMDVVQGNGASVEARYREWWSLDRDDPLRRVTLAFALAQRHSEEGAWCDEVEALLQPLDEGPARYWAALAGRQRDLRCTGDTGHSDAELRRIVRDAAKEREDALEEAESRGEPPPELPPVEDALGWADGVVARLRAAYIKPDLPGDLDLLLEREPHRVAEVGVLWTDEVGGPARGPARRVAKQALDAAVESDDPIRVHGALLAWREAGKDKQAEEATARLAALDPEADPELVRSVDDVADPEIYRTIDACLMGYDRDSAISCLESIADVPEAGAVAAHWYSQQRALFDVARREDDAYAAARSAYQADPDHTFNARLFARRAHGRAEDVDLAITAIDGVVEGWTTEVPDDQRAPLAKDLELRSRLLLLAERPGDAVDAQRAALELDPGPTRHVVLGQALAAEAPDAAVLHLSHGLAEAFDDTALTTAARALLEELSGDWHPDGMPGLIEEAARPLGEEVSHPLVGAELPDLGLPEPEDDAADEGDEADEADEEAPEPTTVYALWVPWHPESLPALERLASITEMYADRGVSSVALDVGLDETELPDDLDVVSEHVGASAVRALRLVAVPSVVIVDAEDRIVDVIVGWDRSSLQLEEALDDFLPEEDEDAGE